jgi:Tfp pilus assembly protein PilN
MIKINLLKNLGMHQGGALAGGAGAAESVESAISPDVQRLAIVKVIVLLLFPIALFGFEKINLMNLEAEVKKLKEETATVTAQKDAFGSVAPRVAKFDLQKKEIEKQLEAVRELTKNRLREVKTLDILQSLVPDQTWLNSVEINSSIVKIEGYAANDDAISKLMKALESSVLFSQIVPKSTTRVDLPTGSVKKFQLEFKVGKQE